MWLLSGKVIVALIWSFWMITVDSELHGNPADLVIIPKPIVERPEYFPTVSYTHLTLPTNREV